MIVFNIFIFIFILPYWNSFFKGFYIKHAEGFSNNTNDINIIFIVVVNYKMIVQQFW